MMEMMMPLTMSHIHFVTANPLSGKPRRLMIKCARCEGRYFSLRRMMMMMPTRMTHYSLCWDKLSPNTLKWHLVKHITRVRHLQVKLGRMWINTICIVWQTQLFGKYDRWWHLCPLMKQSKSSLLLLLGLQSKKTSVQIKSSSQGRQTIFVTSNFMGPFLLC